MKNELVPTSTQAGSELPSPAQLAALRAFHSGLNTRLAVERHLAGGAARDKQRAALWDGLDGNWLPWQSIGGGRMKSRSTLPASGVQY